jgi:hypothetical protein
MLLQSFIRALIRVNFFTISQAACSSSTRDMQLVVRLGRGNRKDGEWSADEERWGMTRAELEKRILRLHKDGMGLLKIGKTLGVGTGLVQGVVRPFEASAAVSSA